MGGTPCAVQEREQRLTRASALVSLAVHAM